MASGWASFRKQWVKPEVYPLIGSMVAALGVCGAAIGNKILDPTVPWNKSKRQASMEAQMEGVDEVKPLWSGSKAASVRIFGGGNPIMENKLMYTELEQDTFVVKTDNEEEEEEEQDGVEEEVVAEEQTVIEAVSQAVVDVAPPVLDIVDEAAETINAAVDAAINAAAEGTATPAASSFDESVGGETPQEKAA